MKKIFRIQILLAGIFSSVSAMAHPGHDHHHENQIFHYLTSPVHIASILIVLLGLLYLLYPKKINEVVKSFFKK